MNHPMPPIRALICSSKEFYFLQIGICVCTILSRAELREIKEEKQRGNEKIHKFAGVSLRRQNRFETFLVCFLISCCGSAAVETECFSANESFTRMDNCSQERKLSQDGTCSLRIYISVDRKSFRPFRGFSMETKSLLLNVLTFRSERLQKNN